MANMPQKLPIEGVSCRELLLEKVIAYLQSLELSELKAIANVFESQMRVWMPASEESCVGEPAPVAHKVRSVQPKTQVVARLRNTGWWRVLKQYAAVRCLARWLWVNGYPLYVNQISRFSFYRAKQKWRPLTKLSDFVRGREISTYKLVDSTMVETPMPTVLPLSDQGCMLSPHDRYRFPEIFVATIKNAMAYGGTNLTLVDGHVICHDLYDFERDYTSEELHGCTLIDPKSKRIRWLLHDEGPERISEAAVFVDACARNYAHWMTEVLPRVALFCAEERFQGIPIVVNDGLHKNIMESLFLVAGTDREIITLPIGRALVADELYLTSVSGYVPFERRETKLSGHSHGMFNPRALELLSKKMDALRGKREAQDWPEKIFLRRNSGARKITNGTELEKLMASRGYAIVEPERLTFLQQVQLFNRAKIIFSPTGAALANALFCRPETQLVVLMGKHENMIYRYWCNMLSPLRINVRYILCKIIENKNLGIHGDFAVDMADVVYLLETMEIR